MSAKSMLGSNRPEREKTPHAPSGDLARLTCSRTFCAAGLSSEARNTLLQVLIVIGQGIRIVVVGHRLDVIAASVSSGLSGSQKTQMLDPDTHYASKQKELWYFVLIFLGVIGFLILLGKER